MDALKIAFDQLPRLVNAAVAPDDKLASLESWALKVIDYDVFFRQVLHDRQYFWSSLAQSEKQAITSKYNRSFVRKYFGRVSGLGTMTLSMNDGVATTGQVMRWAGILRFAGSPSPMSVDVMSSGGKAVDVVVDGLSFIRTEEPTFAPVQDADAPAKRAFLLK